MKVLKDTIYITRIHIECYRCSRFQSMEGDNLSFNDADIFIDKGWTCDDQGAICPECKDDD